MEIIIKFAIFVFGLMIGSFLNVCIFRLPHDDMSVRRPSRSFCPECKEMIPWYDNIPILSFLLLKGKCRFCSKKISILYPIVELLTAVMFVLFLNVFGLSVKMWALLLLGSGLIIASFVDIRHRIIPDEISVGGIIIGIILGGFSIAQPNNLKNLPSICVSLIGALVVAGIVCIVRIMIPCLQQLFSKNPQKRNLEEEAQQEDVDLKSSLGELLLLVPSLIIGWYFFRLALPFLDSANFRLVGMANALIGASVGAAIIYVTAVIGDIIFRKESMGGGDIKLLAAIGAFLGWQQVVLTFVIAPFFGAVVGIIVKIVKKTSLIPYGPFLSMAAIMVLFEYDFILKLWNRWLSYSF